MDLYKRCFTDYIRLETFTEYIFFGNSPTQYEINVQYINGSLIYKKDL